MFSPWKVAKLLKTVQNFAIPMMCYRAAVFVVTLGDSKVPADANNANNAAFRLLR